MARVDEAIPDDLRRAFDAGTRTWQALDRVVETYGRAVGADRCLLFVYRIERGLSRLAAQWQARPEWAITGREAGWATMPEELAGTDPMFALALTDPNAIYVDDIDTADPGLVNAAYERTHFRHHALIHAPVLDAGRLTAIIEPCTMAARRDWTGRDREITAWTQDALRPVVREYLREGGR